MILGAMGGAASLESLALALAPGLLPQLVKSFPKQPKKQCLFISLLRQSGKFMAGQLASDSAVCGRLCAPWLRDGAQGKGSLTGSCSKMTFFLSFRSLFEPGKLWASPGQRHERCIRLRAAKRCHQSFSPLEREGIHLQGGKVPALEPSASHGSCIAVSRGDGECVGPGGAWLVRLRLIPRWLLSGQGGLPAWLPRGGQEVAEDPGAPSLASLPAAFARSPLCHRRLTGKYTECPAHVNKPSYK